MVRDAKLRRFWGVTQFKVKISTQKSTVPFVWCLRFMWCRCHWCQSHKCQNRFHMVSSRHYNNNIYYFIVSRNPFSKMKMTLMTLTPKHWYTWKPIRYMIPQNDHHLPCYQKQPFGETNHCIKLMACPQKVTLTITKTFTFLCEFMCFV